MASWGIPRTRIIQNETWGQLGGLIKMVYIVCVVVCNSDSVQKWGILSIMYEYMLYFALTMELSTWHHQYKNGSIQLEQLCERRLNDGWELPNFWIRFSLSWQVNRKATDSCRFQLTFFYHRHKDLLLRCHRITQHWHFRCPPWNIFLTKLQRNDKAWQTIRLNNNFLDQR